MERKPSGAPSRCEGSYTFMRMTAWGQTSEHLPQSMQRLGSQMGISRAMPRFSYLVVPVMKDPSTGKALTGRPSPSLASSWTVTRLTKSGASSGAAIRATWPHSTTSGTFTWASSCSERSMAAKFLATMTGPRFP